jgi:NAD-dependent DNA ligase
MASAKKASPKKAAASEATSAGSATKKTSTKKAPKKAAASEATKKTATNGTKKKDSPKKAAKGEVGPGLSGHNVLVTGTVPGISREQFGEWLEQQGATAAKGLTNSVTILIVAEKAGEKKLEAANEKKEKGQDLSILDLADFQQQYGLPQEVTV